MDFAQPIPRSSYDIFNKQLESRIDRSLALPASYASSSATSTASSPAAQPAPQSHRRRATSFLSNMGDTSTSASGSDEWTLEYARGADTRRRSSQAYGLGPGLAAAESDLLHDEHSLFVGASPASTAAHHASAMTLGAGIFAGELGGKRAHGHGVGQGHGAASDDDDEFDPDRSIARLINKLGKGRGLSMLDEPAQAQPSKARAPLGGSTAHNTQPPASRRTSEAKKTPAHTAPAPAPAPTYTTSRPRQPSPLRRSPINAYVRDEADETFSFSLLDATPRPAARAARDSGEEGEFSKLARRIQGDLEGHGNGHGHGGAQREKAGLRVESGSARATSATAHARKRETSKAAASTVTAATPQADRFPSSKAESRRATNGVAGGGAGALADLTSLTGMLATPARGMGYKGVGEDAAAPGDSGTWQVP